MAGNKNSGRPGGNPDIKNYGFKTDRDEPLRASLHIRLTPSIKSKLKTKENWQERVRDAIAQIALEEEENIKSA
ncbi:MAG: hypothetical protein QNJ54_06730 [Prochloraceae cyanobacterium]|nr:hypothetical protein [Prochloraceae cyanobacterium]